MNLILNFLRDKHSLWYKFILFLFSSLLIVWMLPDSIAFQKKIQFQAGKPWNQEKLVAPFDFAIQKTETEILTEKEEVLKNRKYFFLQNPSILNSSFYQGFLQRLRNNRQQVVSRIILDSVFRRGIIETSEITSGKPDNFPVFLIQDNIQNEFKLGDFFNLQTADRFVNEKLAVFTPDEADFLRDSLISFFSVSVFYNRDFSEKVLKDQLSSILPTRGLVLKGQTIVDNGEILTSEKLNILNSFQHELYISSGNSSGNNGLWFLGQFLVTVLSLSMLMFYLYFFRKPIFSQNSEVTFIFITILIFVFLAARFSGNTTSFLYYVPFSIAPILIRTFFDTRTSLFTHLNLTIIVSFFAQDQFVFVFLQLFAGIAAIFSVAALSRRSQLFTSIVAVFLSYTTSFLALKLIQNYYDFNFNFNELTPFLFSSLFVIFAYPLIYFSEKFFGFISDFTLLELSGSNSKLLRELATIAPGTFQHSLQVATLAEEAIFKVGGNSLLVRAGALYHDIGKMKNPRYFIENRVGGTNPHEEISFEESAAIIIKHVLDGIEIAKANNLPDQIIDFIRTHHGTTLTRFFYRSHQLQHQNENVDESKFRYPGPIPYSKETAVLMMADSVEAASRSLKVYDAASIDQLVDRIIDSQISENQFLNSDITFRDIHSIKKIFKRRLMNIYHVRIEYPR